MRLPLTTAAILLMEGPFSFSFLVCAAESMTPAEIVGNVNDVVVREGKLGAERCEVELGSLEMAQPRYRSTLHFLRHHSQLRAFPMTFMGLKIELK